MGNLPTAVFLQDSSAN